MLSLLFLCNVEICRNSSLATYCPAQTPSLGCKTTLSHKKEEMVTRSRRGCVYSRKNWEWVGISLRRTDDFAFFCSSDILAWNVPFSKATLHRDTKLLGLEETEPKSCRYFRYLRTTCHQNWDCPKWTGIPQVEQSYHGSYQGLCRRMKPRQRKRLN